MTTRFEFEEWDGGLVRVNREFADVLRHNRLTTFAAFMNLQGGQVAREVGPRVTSRILLHDGRRDGAFYIKRHGTPSWWEFVKPLLRLNWPILGARNEWDAILQFHEAGLPTMTPVAFGECGSRSFLVTQSLENCRTLLDLTREWPSSFSGEPTASTCVRHLIDEVAHFARTMHEAGLHHQDFYLNHILLPRDAEASEIRVIDLGRVQRRQRLGSRWMIKDLAQLDYSARHLSCRDRLRFLRSYLGRPLNRHDRMLIRRVWLKSQFIARHTRRNAL